MLRRSSFMLAWPLMPLVVGLFPPSAASADSARQCAVESDDRARLACYDRIFGKPAAVASEAGAAGMPATAAATVLSDPQDEFGLTEAARRARDPEKAQEQMPQSLTEAVASVRNKPTGEFVVTLANGQVWSQLQADTRAKVSAGDTVTIRKAALGSHLLVTSGKIATRVRRIK